LAIGLLHAKHQVALYTDVQLINVHCSHKSINNVINAAKMQSVFICIDSSGNIILYYIMCLYKLLLYIHFSLLRTIGAPFN